MISKEELIKVIGLSIVDVNDVSSIDEFVFSDDTRRQKICNYNYDDNDIKKAVSKLFGKNSSQFNAIKTAERLNKLYDLLTEKYGKSNDFDALLDMSKTMSKTVSEYRRSIHRLGGCLKIFYNTYFPKNTEITIETLKNSNKEAKDLKLDAKIKKEIDYLSRVGLNQISDNSKTIFDELSSTWGKTTYAKDARSCLKKVIEVAKVLLKEGVYSSVLGKYCRKFWESAENTLKELK